MERSVPVNQANTNEHRASGLMGSQERLMLDRWYSQYEDSAKMLSSRMALTGRVYEPRSVRHIADSPHAASPRCAWILDCLRGATDGAPCAL
eukprot:6677275-Prymnesium_polylepis.1